MRSVTTRSPDSSVVSVCSGTRRGRLPAIGIAVGARRAPLAVTVAVTAAAFAARPTAVAPRPVPAAAVATAAAAVAGADGQELVLRLPGDVRVLGEAQADAATLLVDLDDADVDLVALVEHLLDRRRALARGDVGDVQHAVRALGELDERPERGGL